MPPREVRPSGQREVLPPVQEGSKRPVRCHNHGLAGVSADPRSEDVQDAAETGRVCAYLSRILPWWLLHWPQYRRGSQLCHQDLDTVWIKVPVGVQGVTGAHPRLPNRMALVGEHQEPRQI